MIFSVISVKSPLLASVGWYITRGIVFSTEMDVSAIVNDVSTRICEKILRIHEVTNIFAPQAQFEESANDRGSRRCPLVGMLRESRSLIRDPLLRASSSG